MNDKLTGEFYETLIENYYRSIIVSKDSGVDYGSNLYDATDLLDGTNYLTLTPKGFEYVLTKYSVKEDRRSNIFKLVKSKEDKQECALLDYLKLERELKSSVVYVMLRDGRVDTDEDMFKDTYCLPLGRFFSSLSRNEFGLVSTDTLITTTKVDSADYGKFLFANESYGKILTVFINVSQD